MIRAGYKLDGTALVFYSDLAFTAPMAVSAMVEPGSGSNQAWLNALWDEVESSASSGYYNDSLKLLAMIVMSGNWWSP
jgi:hypothetical protein